MLHKLSLAAMAFLIAAPLAQADDYRAKGEFCRLQKMGVDRSASDAASLRFAQLHKCNTFCSRAAVESEANAASDRLAVLAERCNTAFDELPTDIMARYGAAPIADDMSRAAQMRDMANKCDAMGKANPRLISRKSPSSNHCISVCNSGADRIEEAGEDLGGFADRCQQEYDGVKARASRAP